MVRRTGRKSTSRRSGSIKPVPRKKASQTTFFTHRGTDFRVFFLCLSGSRNESGNLDGRVNGWHECKRFSGCGCKHSEGRARARPFFLPLPPENSPLRSVLSPPVVQICSWQANDLSEHPYITVPCWSAFEEHLLFDLPFMDEERWLLFG